MSAEKLRAVLADDESHHRALLKAVLKSMEFEVVGEARNGREAVELFRAHRPDLAFLDMNMPIMTGDEALKEILAEFPDALVIMLTSITDAATVEACVSLGAANYIRKDTPLAEMRKIIKETIQG